MEWMFLISTNRRERVESRILQVLDHHMVPMRSFSSARIGAEIRISFIVETDEANALRTAHLLRKARDVQKVEVFAADNALCRTVALFKVLCDQESRLPLLQVVSSLGAQVIAVRPDSVTFEILGSLPDIHGLRESLLPYGVVENISAATVAVRREVATPLSETAIEEIPAKL